MAQIVSASRRTDIPAFYSKWLLNRLMRGYTRVQNPYNPNQVSEISLTPSDVDTVVFWSKNPKPLLSHLGSIQQMGYRYYFQFTLNNYPAALEPGLAPIQERIDTFKRLSSLVGPRRVVWRYDPIIISIHTDCSYHLRIFDDLCRQIGTYTKRVVVSLVDYYKKTLHNLASLDRSGYQFVQDAEIRPEVLGLLKQMSECASAHSIGMFSCAEDCDLSSIGIKPSACIDGELIQELWGIDKKWKKDPGQRKACRCVISKDIGVFDSCLHGCLYCYATSNLGKARERYIRHDPSGDYL